MGLTLTNSTIDKYFGFLTELDNASKKRLIAKLKASIVAAKDDSVDLAKLHGAWEDSRSSDEVIREIRDARVDKNDSVEF